MKTPRLTVKLFIALGLTVLVIIMTNSVIYQYIARAYITEQFFLRGEVLIQPLWQKVNFNLKVGGNRRSLYGLSHLCQQIKASSPDLLEVSVIDSTGQILAHNDISRIWKQIAPVFIATNEKRIFRETPTTLDVYLPVSRNIKTPLLVKVSFSKNLIEQQSLKAFWLSLAFSATAIVLFLFIIYIMANAILGKRIARLLNGFKLLAQGELGIRLSPNLTSVNKFYQADELDLLITSFDQMAGRLETINNERESQKKQLMFLATHDELTGLPNRRLLEERLKHAIIRAHKGKSSVILFMDVDNFKFVNDTLGHTAGDKVLVALTGLLKEQIGSQQILARFGGDEFALLMEKGTGIEDGKKLAAQICLAVEKFRFEFKQNSFYFGLSIGIVLIDGKNDADIVLSQADNAMYTAKKLGKNRFQVYNPENEELDRISQTTEWITKLKDAINNDGFLLYFQPVKNLNNQKIEHYEALLRLKDAQDRVILPGAFIKVAEEFGLMSQIDHWVIGKVISLLRDVPEIKIFINLSAVSLADEKLLKFIEERIAESGVVPARIGFEITETVAIKDLELTGRWINRLKTKGCQFALDDFGSGFNSFVYLKQLPVNQLKLDGSFIQTLDREPAQRAFVEAMHQLATALGVKTVAEFVENESILRILTEIGVHYGQGFYLGKPESTFKLK